MSRRASIADPPLLTDLNLEFRLCLTSSRIVGDQFIQYPALALGFTWLGNGSRMLLGALFQITSARFDIRLTICAATPPAAPNNPHHPNVTKPQCNGAANSSSTNQNAWPHSLSPTLGRIIIGPTIAPTNGNDTLLANCGNRVMA